MIKWGNLQIRHKIMSVIVLMVLVTMGVVLPIISNIIKVRMEERLSGEIHGIGNYVTQLFEDYKIKSLNYVTLFMYDNSLQEATYHAASLKWRDPLVAALQARFKALDLNGIEVLSTQGDVLVRGHDTKRFGDNKKEYILLKSALSDKKEIDLGEDEEGIYAIRASAPLKDEGDNIGVVITSINLDNKFAEGIKELSGAEIAIIKGNTVVASTLPSLQDTQIEKKITSRLDEGETADMVITVEKVPYSLYYAPMYAAKDKARAGALMIGISRQSLVDAERQTAGVLLLIMVIAIGAAILVGFAISQGIVKPIIALNAAAGVIASQAGDLTLRVKVTSMDEVGKLADTFNKIMQTIHDMFLKIRTTADRLAASSEELSSATEEVNASTEEISATIQKIAKGVVTQAKRIEDTSRLMEEMSNSVKQVADNSKTASDTSAQSLKVAQNGGDSTKQAVEKMNRITITVDGAAKVVQSLGEKSKQIGQITDTITTIADQTNLLALNAAIEAARAGEAGRGFAVVAEEVRKLAEGSAEAARRIGALIEGIQVETPKAVASMEAGTKEVNEGAHIVSLVSDARAQIIEAAKKSANMVNEITVATEQQLSNSNQIMKAINEVAAVAEDSASATEETSSSAEQQTASMEEMSSSAQELARLAMDLKDMVSRFKFNENSGKEM
ncbi:MAG: HAMP domain-containing protein [Candidatus Omnitrophica bacterium]|nr:HAMP domain-containing protein [Candidatus Omnitrophota bacterium]